MTPNRTQEGQYANAPARISRRQALLGAAGAAGLAGCRPSASVAGKRVLTIWHAWSGVMTSRFADVVAAFERAHPHIAVRSVFTWNDLSSNQKFFTSVAAGMPPDLTFVDGPQVASWAEWGALEPLTNRVREEEIREDQYFPPTWKQNVYKGEVWALTYSADPNFGFCWNREAFRRGGLDPDRPPKTIDELTQAAHQLSHVEGGVIRSIGLIPWEQYGPANSMFTWGWAFGGDFYDYALGRITADHPGVVAALEWMASFAKRYDPSRVQSMRDSLGGADQDPFYTGRMAMRCLHIAGINDIARYAPGLDYGVTFLPAPPTGEAHSSWVGGWCMAIPRGSRQPNLAWDFIRWAGWSPEGTAEVGRRMKVLPAMRRSPVFDEVRGQGHYGEYVRILEEARHQRPVMPAQAVYMRELQRAVEAAVYGRLTPSAALAKARRNTQTELDLIRAG